MILDGPSPGLRDPPPARALYWACQALGWSAFCAIIMGGYLVSSGGRLQTGSVVNVLWITLVVCPAMAHGLRWWMWRRGWVELQPSKRVPRVAVAVVVCGVALAAVTGVSLYLLQGPPPLPFSALVSMAGNFSLALGTWCAIYFGVRANRRHAETLAAARDAQLRTLKAQLNPHFLFMSAPSLLRIPIGLRRWSQGFQTCCDIRLCRTGRTQ